MVDQLIKSASEHGQESKLIEEVNRLKANNPDKSDNTLYNLAYQIVMKT
jgi:hypothetical protein|tara:strand:+ start:273 stop:419 length:147 start_codon:yes stop_codon:yes gene_type:complete